MQLKSFLNPEQAQIVKKKKHLIQPSYNIILDSYSTDQFVQEKFLSFDDTIF